MTYLFVDTTNLITSTTNELEFTRTKKLRGTNVSVLIVAADTANKTNSASINFDPNQNLLYDANGNLTNDGEYSYSYNLENRLTKCSTSVSLVNYSYDGIGRKTKSKEINLATGETNETKFIYDNWNLILELSTSQLHSLTSSYCWGTDLSGTLHGVGGIGGLLANSPLKKGDSGGCFFFTFDANGNVINLINSEGETAAHYEYSPFGKTISQTGYYAATNKFRFSTKRFENVGELYYYGYRYYKPKTGSWLTRDPIREKGGVNLYGFVNNLPTCKIDAHGKSATLVVLLAIAAELIWTDICKDKAVDKARSTFPNDDKKQHCYTSCFFNRCMLMQPGPTFLGGILHELLNPNYGWKDALNDIKANLHGIALSYTTKSCKKACKCYPKNNEQ